LANKRFTIRKLALLWSLSVLLLMWYPFAPGPPSLFGNPDLPLHYGLFIGVGVLWKLSFAKNNWKGWLIPPLLLALAAETGQILIPHRSAEGIDFIFNLLGLLGGWLIVSNEQKINRSLAAGLLAGGWVAGWGTAAILVGNQLLILFSRTLPAYLTLLAGLISTTFLGWLWFRKKTKIYLPLIVQLTYLITAYFRPQQPAILTAGLLLSALWLVYDGKNQLEELLCLYLLIPLLTLWGLGTVAGPALIISYFGGAAVALNLFILASYYLRSWLFERRP